MSIGGITTLVASNSADTTDLTDYSITSGIDGTYDEYVFVMTDIGPATNQADFQFQVNASGQSGYNESITSATYGGYATDSGSLDVAFRGGQALGNGTGAQIIAPGIGNEADESCVGILHLYKPADTNFVTHFIFRTHFYEDENSRSYFYNGSGYINVAAAITNIQFKMSSGNFDGLIQMYGVA